MRLLVTGGAGYIGSLTAERLLERGHEVVVVDDLSSGHAEDVPSGAHFVEASIADRSVVAALCETHGIEACVHFAGRIAMGESMVVPERYWATNVGETLVLFKTLIDAGVDAVVLSSTAGVYGTPDQLPIDEQQPTVPASTYGQTKLVVEQVAQSMAALGRLRFVALRYFNAAGGAPGHAERHRTETHLIPLAIAAAVGHRPALQLFGTDYPTPDGTCIRDYIHVEDLAEAHVLAVEAFDRGLTSLIANLGTGTGYSNREVLAMVSTVTGREVPVVEADRRPGDAAELVASSALATEVLGWVPRHSSLEQIVADAWAGYQAAFGTLPLA